MVGFAHIVWQVLAVNDGGCDHTQADTAVVAVPLMARIDLFDVPLFFGSTMAGSASYHISRHHFDLLVIRQS